MVKRIQGVVEGVGALLLAVVVAIVLIQVVSRYVLRMSISWPEELARYVLVWLMFFGATAAAAAHRHIVVDTVTELLPRRPRLVLQGIATLAGLLAIGILVTASQALFGPASRSTSPATGLPSFWIYLALPVGGALLGLFTLAELVQVLRGRELRSHELEEVIESVAEERRG